MTDVLRKKREDTETDMHRGTHNATAETGEIDLQLRNARDGCQYQRLRER